MEMIISNTKIASNKLPPFTPNFDRVFVSVDNETFEHQNEVELSSDNLDVLITEISYSWDGEIYIFNNKDKESVLSLLNEWFSDEDNHPEFDEDYGIGNCLLIKESPNGLFLIDTQTDNTSNIQSFIKNLNDTYPDIKYDIFADNHLIDHMYLGRGMNNNEFELLYLMYKENIIDETFLFKGVDQIKIDDKSSKYYQIIPNDKVITFVGELAHNMNHWIKYMVNGGFKTSNEITDDSYVLLGKNVDQTTLDKIESLNLKSSNISDVIDSAFAQYHKNIASKNTHKP